MKDKAIAVAGIAIVSVIIAWYTTSTHIHKSFIFNGVNYKFTSVALTQQQQEQGLMNSSVNQSTFELFVFPSPAIYPFWMKDTYSPLDIIWINQSTVVFITNATPCVSYSKDQSNCTVYVPSKPSNYVIEAAAGFVNRTGMHIGSQVQIN
ncbi:MAG: DUF192 domain-containing protein [Candidatus Micrarchaeota archaeon]|nr:DUF192 domain-containing protein [Candidatus Micrarchaeota archaeon]MDE1834863.1 DUF192 domain-containing protein [Candidatus Micrarchaeota archaeon]MDE1859901.1 DUF192 domain-containing protein [Candidatus Micrarchaeota archaeon]